MSEVVLIALIGFMQAVTVAIIGVMSARDGKKRKIQLDNAEVRASLRAEESRLAMKLMSADMQLSVATAVAVRDQKSNGRMESALKHAEEVEKEYFDFINAIAAKKIGEA
jgi:hypothetical protein